MSSPLQRRYVRTLIAGAVCNALTAAAAAVGGLVWWRAPATATMPGIAQALAAGSITLAAFVIGFLVMRRALRPGQRFLGQAEVMLAGLPDGRAAVHKGPQTVFEHIADWLSRIDDRHWFPAIIGDSRSMQVVRRQVRLLAPTGIDALVSGETGTGKTLLAEAIHRLGPGGEGPLVSIDCRHGSAAELAPESDSGTEYAGAAMAVARARGGTLLLEAIEALPADLQAHLAAALDASGPEGGRRTWRLVATTGTDLGGRVATGRFHAGLYARLERFRIELPPLRKRIDDLPALCAHFLADDPQGTVVETTALQALIGYDWPGNVKELGSVLASAASLSSGQPITRAHLPPAIQAAGGLRLPSDTSEAAASSIDAQLQSIERQMIAAALQKTGGIQVRAAELLGINQRSLWHRIKKYGIDAQAYRKA